MRLLEIKATHALYVCKERDQLELDADPVTPLTLPQHEFLILHADLNHRINWVHRNREWFRRSRIVSQKRIVGADQAACNPIILYLDGNDLSAFDGARCGHRIISVKGKSAVRTPQIGRPHAREGCSFGGYRRKIRRNTEYRVRNPVLVEDLPKCNALPKLLCAAPA